MQLDDIIIFLIIAGSIVTSIIRSIGEQNRKRPPTQGQRPPQPVQRGQTPESGQTSQSGQTAQPGQTLQGDLQKRLEEARRRVQQAMESQTGRGSEGEIGRAPAPPPLISGGLEGTSLEGRGSLEGTSLEGQTQRRGTLESSGGLLQEQDYTLKRQPLKPEEMKRERLQDTLIKGEKNVFRPIDTSYRNPSDFQQQVTTGQPFMAESSRQRSVAEATPMERKRRPLPTTTLKHAKISGSELLSPEMLTEKELLRGFLWQQILSEPRAKTGFKKPQLRAYPMQRAKAEGKKG